jgi:hypothetical protein
MILNNVFNPNPVFASVTVSNLTPTRITYAGTAGVLADSANLTFDGTNVGLAALCGVSFAGDISACKIFNWKNSAATANYFTVINNTAAAPLFAQFLTTNLDGAALVSFRLIGKAGLGTGPAPYGIGQLETNDQRFVFRYTPTGPRHEILSSRAGTTLAYLPIAIYIDGFTNQLVLNIDGSVSMAGLLTADSLTIDKLSTLTEGILIGSTGDIEKDVSDLTFNLAAQKTIVLNPVVYDDIQFPIASGKVPASHAPTFETFTTNTSAYSFAVDDYIDLQANEFAHWWKQGTNGDAHLHITTKAANSTGSNRFAKFTIVFAYVDTGEVWVEAPLTAELTIPTGTAALQAFYLDMGDLTLTNYLIGGQIRCRMSRITATGGTEYSGNIFITQCGVHLQKDTMGSRQETVK